MRRTKIQLLEVGVLLLQKNIRYFQEGNVHKYFTDLFENNNLKSTNDVANNIIKKYT